MGSQGRNPGCTPGRVCQSRFHSACLRSARSHSRLYCSERCPEPPRRPRLPKATKETRNVEASRRSQQSTSGCRPWPPILQRNRTYNYDAALTELGDDHESKLGTNSAMDVAHIAVKTVMVASSGKDGSRETMRAGHAKAVLTISGTRGSQRGGLLQAYFESDGMRGRRVPRCEQNTCLSGRCRGNTTQGIRDGLLTARYTSSQ